MSEVEELRRRVGELEGVVLRLAGALASMRMAPDGQSPAVSWTLSIESVAAPLVERRRAPARDAWEAEMSLLT